MAAGGNTAAAAAGAATGTGKAEAEAAALKLQRECGCIAEFVAYKVGLGGGRGSMGLVVVVG